MKDNINRNMITDEFFSKMSLFFLAGFRFALNEIKI